MYDNEKVYSIDLGEDLVIEKDHGEPAATGSEQAGMDSPAQKSRFVLRSKTASQAQKAVRKGKMAPRRLHFALLVPLVFLAGPLAVLLTPEGRTKRDWVVVGLIMWAGWIGLALGHGKVAVWLTGGSLQVPAAVLTATFLIGGFTAWARGVALVSGENRPPDHRLPIPMRRAWGTGFMGIVAPGMGLLAAGRNRRASAVVWMGWIPVAALAFAVMGESWWPGRVPSEGFEKTLLTSWVLVGIGIFAWLVQALEGARLVPWEGYRYHSRRGEILGLVAVLGVLVLMISGDLSPVARQLGRQAREYRAEGYGIIPLALVRTASVLDPGRTDYVVTELEILEEMGRPAPAAELRHRLESDLAPYLDLVQTEKKAREDARRWAEAQAATQQAFTPLGLYEPDPFPKKKNPEATASGSLADE